MWIKRGIISLVMICLFINGQMSSLALADDASFKIGIPLVQTEEETRSRWQPLADYLTRSSQSNHQFQIEVLDLQQLESAVAFGQVDFLLVNPSLYVVYSYKYGLTSPLATLVTSEQGYSLNQFAGVVFTRSDRADISSFEDLKGKVVAIPSVRSLAAYQMQAYELLRRGIDPQRDLTLMETKLPLTNTLNAVMNGDADAGFMRAGMLETWKSEGLIKANSYRIIEPRQFGGFPWISSTRLYPEWPFAALSHTDPFVVRDVTAALLSLPLNGPVADTLGIAGFTVPGDYRGIDRLLRELKLDPFDNIPALTFRQVWSEWQFWGWLFILGLAGILSSVIVVLKRKNAALAQSHFDNAFITQQLQENEALLNHAQQVALIGSWEYDIDKKEYNCTDQLCVMLGLKPSRHLILDDFIAPVVEEDKSLVINAWNDALTKAKDYDIDYRICLNNEVRWVHEKLHVIRDEFGKVVRLLGTVQDVNEKIQYEQHIETLAFNDPLTQIPNRAWIHKELSKVLERKHLKSHSGFLLMLNIDRFKTINNARGSRYGDALLKAVGHRLQSCQFGDAMIKVARMAGDEFGVLIVSTHFAEMPLIDLEHFLMDHCQHLFSTPFMIDDEPVVVGVSVGVVRFPETETRLSADEIFQRANMALTHSRLEGGGHLSFYETKMSNAAAHRFKLERDLKRAVEKKELRLFMQPQFNVAGEKVAAELLLRWEHPELGMISPAEFIPIAESSNLIVDLGEWVMNQAAQLLHLARQKEISLHLSINISPRHFAKSSFVPWLNNLVKEQKIDPKFLVLEVTEGLFLHNLDSVSEKMRSLRTLGIEFSIDDFGTGYSSLAYLKRLPVNEIKIDKAFVQDAPQDADDAALIDALLAVAEKMQLRVVAEGVETFEQADFLKQCSQSIIYQGYLFGRPAPVEEWLAFWNQPECPLSNR